MVFLRILQIASILITFKITTRGKSLNLMANPNIDHLVVLSHGLMGYPSDLEYLGRSLAESGCTVLQSRSNEFIATLNGVSQGGKALAEEIMSFKTENPHLKRVTFVGNSLGGLYVRYAVKVLYNETNASIAGLEPHKFMTIATPHLGVRNFNFWRDLGIPLPNMLIDMVASTMSATGRDLFLNDFQSQNDFTSTLLYEMATKDEFLVPLNSFTDRQLYANLANDLMVPLGTAAFIPQDIIDDLKQSHNAIAGIVKRITVGKKLEELSSATVCTLEDTTRSTLPFHLNMMDKLDECGWNKIIVNFPGFLPLAHNKICALKKKPDIISSLLGFHEGRFVMDDAAQWILN